MKNPIVKLMRTRWFAGCLHAAAWVLLCLALAHLGGTTPAFSERDSASSPHCPVPTAKLDSLFAPGIWPAFPAQTNRMNLFASTYFAPDALAPGKPPTSRKIELTYLGFYQSVDGPKRAMVKLGNGFITSPLGSKLASNLFVAQLTMQTMTLTNPAAQTNLLSVNTRKEIEVPLK
jgi:hypothetical protein